MQEIPGFSVFSHVFPFAMTHICHLLMAADRLVHGHSFCGFPSPAFSCRRMTLSFKSAVSCRNLNFAISQFFSWRFHRARHVMRHEAFIILCCRRKSNITAAIHHGPPIGFAPSDEPLCTSHCVSFIADKTRVVRSAPRLWHRPFHRARLPHSK